MTIPFAHLRVHSDYSLGQGTSKVKKLVAKAKGFGQPALALTDSRNLHGALEFSGLTFDNGMQPLIGTKIFVKVSDYTSGSVILLAQNSVGYANICRLTKMALMPGRAPELCLDREAFGEIVAGRKNGDNYTDGIIAIAGVGADSLIQRQLEQRDDTNDATKIFDFVASLFPDRFYVEICRNGYPTDKDTKFEKYALGFAMSRKLPIVATSEVWYADPDRHDAWEILKAVGGDKVHIDYAVETGLKRSTARSFHLRSTEEMMELFHDLPEAFENAAAIAQRCAFKADKRNPILPTFDNGTGLTEAEELRKQAKEGLEARFATVGISAERQPEYWARLEFELSVIEKMGFPGYFLIVGDFIKWAKDQDIPVGPGRGSGAGSVVAWALTITDLDPLRFGLLFERFLNPDRVSMPDFDVDFCEDRRLEVVEYVKKKYGVERVAQIVTFTEMGSKTSLKDVARVVSTEAGLIPYFEINELTAAVPPDPDTPAQPANLELAYELSSEFRSKVEGTETSKVVYHYAKEVEGLNRNAGAHAAGIVIAGEVLTKLVPVGVDPKTSTQVVQFNMKDSEKVGLVKFDFLGLKTLSVIKEALRHIKATTGEDIDINLVPYEDPPVYEMLSKGLANGVFQLESDGMKNQLREIKPTSLEDLIAIVSLYRPGPMEMIPTYARRKNGLEKPEYPEPAHLTEKFLSETFGIMVYQEQVMQVAQVSAGYSLGEADLLRRAMGKKIKSEMDAQKTAFIAGCLKNNIEEKKASDLFDLIEKFAGYGFNKSHAAAYAAIAFQTAWLKYYYPAQFFAALMTYNGKPEKLALIKQDMDHFGVPLLLPDINKSNLRFSPEKLPDGKMGVRLGLKAVKSITEAAQEMIVERAENGPYKSLIDFHKRANEHFSSAQMTKLVESGALDEIAPEGIRQRAVQILTFLAKNATKQKAKDDKTYDMFAGMGGGEPAPIMIPPKEQDKPEWADKADREFNSLGFFFKEHPLDYYLTKLKRGGGVRDRAKIFSTMERKKIDSFKEMKLLGMVEDCEKKEWNNSSYSLRIKLAEREETYTINISERDQDVDEGRAIVEKAKRERQPIVVIADCVFSENGPKSYGRRVMLAEDYLIACQLSGTHYITIDISKFPYSTEDQARYREVTNEAGSVSSDEEKVQNVEKAVAIARPYMAQACQKIKETLAPAMATDNGGALVHLIAVYEHGNIAWRKVFQGDIFGGRFNLTKEVKADIGATKYCVSFLEEDEALSTNEDKQAA